MFKDAAGVERSISGVGPSYTFYHFFFFFFYYMMISRVSRRLCHFFVELLCGPLHLFMKLVILVALSFVKGDSFHQVAHEPQECQCTSESQC